MITTNEFIYVHTLYNLNISDKPTTHRLTITEEARSLRIERQTVGELREIQGAHAAGHVELRRGLAGRPVTGKLLAPRYLGEHGRQEGRDGGRLAGRLRQRVRVEAARAARRHEGLRRLGPRQRRYRRRAWPPKVSYSRTRELNVVKC